MPGLIRTVTAGDLRRGGEFVSKLALVAEVGRFAGPPKVITSREMSFYLPDSRRLGGSLLFATVEIDEALGFQYIEQELREGLDEIERAPAHEIRPLVTAVDLSGVLHAHSTASDSVDALKAMAEASLALGYQYIGLTDHSKTAHYAGGLTIAEIEQQQN